MNNMNNVNNMNNANNNINNLSTQEIYEKLIAYSEQYPILLDEYKKSYITYTKNPGFSEYEATYTSNKEALQHIHDNIASIETHLQQNIDRTNEKITIIDNEIKKEKESNTTLLSVFNQLSGSDNASSMMIENSKQQYNYQYMSNILLFIGIFIALGAIRIASASV